MNSTLQTPLYTLLLSAFCIISPLLAENATPTLGFCELSASGIDTYDANNISKLLKTHIDALGIYKTLDFTDIQTSLAAQNISPKIKDVNSAIIAGQILGTDYFGFGSLDKIGKSYAISMQIIEVRSGRIVNNVSEFYKGNLKKFSSQVLPPFAHELCGVEYDPKKKKK